MLVLEAPYTSLDAVASVHYPFFFAGALVTDRFDSLSRIGEVRLPVLIVHGEDDWVVPTRMGHKLFEAANDPKESAFIAGAGHADLYDHGAAAAVIGFVRRHFAD